MKRMKTIFLTIPGRLILTIFALVTFSCSSLSEIQIKSYQKMDKEKAIFVIGLPDKYYFNVICKINQNQLAQQAVDIGHNLPQITALYNNVKKLSKDSMQLEVIPFDKKGKQPEFDVDLSHLEITKKIERVVVHTEYGSSFQNVEKNILPEIDEDPKVQSIKQALSFAKARIAFLLLAITDKKKSVYYYTFRTYFLDDQNKLNLLHSEFKSFGTQIVYRNEDNGGSNFCPESREKIGQFFKFIITNKNDPDQTNYRITSEYKELIFSSFLKLKENYEYSKKQK